MCLAQGPQRSDAGEARTRGPRLEFPRVKINKIFHCKIINTFLPINFTYVLGAHKNRNEMVI